MRLKFLQVIYESFDCDLIQGFLLIVSIMIFFMMIQIFNKNSAYVVHFFSATIYSMRLKFLQVIYENMDCDLTQGYFIHNFNK